MKYLYSPHWELNPGPLAFHSIIFPSRPLVTSILLRLSNIYFTCQFLTYSDPKWMIP